MLKLFGGIDVFVGPPGYRMKGAPIKAQRLPDIGR
jgi:hypothetical protein